MKTSYNKVFDDIELYETAIRHAIGQRNSIQDNINSYYRIVQIPYTHKFKTGIGGFTWKKETRYRDEQRFDEERFNNDMAGANARIQENQLLLSNACTQAQNIVKSLESQLQYINNSDKTEQYSESDLKNKIQVLKNKLSIVDLNPSSLDSKISYNKNLLNQLNYQCKVANEDLGKLTNKVKQQKDEIQHHTNKLEQDKSEIQSMENKLDETKLAAINKMMTYTPIQRATGLYSCFDKQSNELLMDTILECGFSHEHFAYLALENKNFDIFKIACDFGVNFDIYLLGQSTLAQLVIRAGNPEFIQEMFKCQESSLINSSIYACMENDLASLKTIFEYDKDIFKQSAIGCTVMQVAIANNKFDVVKLILALDPGIAELGTVTEDSYVKQAIRMGHNEIAKLLEEQIKTNFSMQSIGSTLDQLIIDTSQANEPKDKLKDVDHTGEGSNQDEF